MVSDHDINSKACEYSRFEGCATNWLDGTRVIRRDRLAHKEMGEDTILFMNRVLKFFIFSKV